jgi:hypothetical protein
MKADQQACMSGLNSSQHKVVTPGVYSIYTRTTEIPPTGITVTLSQSGSVTASHSSPTAGPITNHVEMNAQFVCAVGDILTAAVTSTGAANDLSPQMIKTTINLKQGV